MKKVIMLTAAFFTMLLISSQAFAENVSMRVYLGSDAQKGVFIVSWTNTKESAAVTLAGPEGRSIAADSSNSVFEPGRVTISVANAKRGYWNVNADGNALGSVSVTGGSLDGLSANTGNSIIDKFTAGYNDGKIDFSWNVVSESDKINLSVYLDGNGGSSRIYYDYSAPRTGRGSVDVSTEGTGIYKVRAEISANGVRASATEENYFYIEQKDAGDKLGGVRCGSVDGDFFILWDSGFGNNNYLVTLYDYDTMSVINTARVYESRFVTPLDNIPSKLKYSVSNQSNRIYGSFDVFEYEKRTPTGEVYFPNVSVTRDECVSVNIECEDECSAMVYLDEERLNDGLKSGEYDLFLSEGEHNILVLISDMYGNLKTFEKSLTVDKTPPVITLSNNDTEVIEGDSITISGSTEPNAVVAVNGVEQTSVSGAFSVKVGVEHGISSVTISAYDAAGNKSVRSITVERKGSVSLAVFEIAAVAAVCIGLLIWYLILNKRGKEVSSNEESN